MNSVKDKILDDLAKDLRRKIAQSMDDYFGLCLVAKLDCCDSAGEVMYMLVDLTTSYAAMTTNIEANEFARLMGLQFLRAKKQNEQEEREYREKAGD